MTLTTAGVAPTDLPFMEPVLRRGRSYLDREILPGDENESRLTRLLERVGEHVDGVILFGAAHLPENLVYYANYTPTTFHGALIARPGHPPTLLAGKGGARDHPYIRTVSWIADIRYEADIGPAILEITGAGRASRLGVAGIDTTLPHGVRSDIVAALGDRIVPVDHVVAEQRRQKSAREVEVLRRARDLAARAAAAAVAAAEAGAGRRTALAAADHAARAGGAHDCRITAGTDRGGVATMSEVTDAPGPVSAVVAVEYLGCWGMAAIRIGMAAAEADLERVVARLSPGAMVRDAVAGATDGPDVYIVNGIGCGLAESPAAIDPDAPLVEGDVLSVVREHRGALGLELDVRTVRVTAGGGRDL